VDGREATIITAADTTSPVVSFISAEPRGATVSGFTITGATAQTGIVAIASSPTISDNIIAGNTSVYPGYDGGGISFEDTEGAVVRGNIFYGNAGRSYGGAIHIEDGRNDTICYNVMYDNHGVGDIRTLSSDGVIFNNTIAVTTWGGIVHQNHNFHRGTMDVRNNIVFGAPESAIRNASAFMITGYNCTFDNLRDYQGVGTGVGAVATDAQFVDSEHHDYRLRASSPCIDAGDPDPWFNDPNGSRNDIGAIPFDAILSAAATEDINGDGVFDVRDVVQTVDALYRLPTDRKVDIAEVARLIKALYGTTLGPTRPAP
jgi:hypothetical protein